MPRIFFGAGSLYALDLSAAMPTPVKFGLLQEVSVEISGSKKELHGGRQFPVDVARGKSKIIGKAKKAEFDLKALASLHLGETPATGELLYAEDELGTIPSDPGPYIITVANSANFYKNLGVRFVGTGLPLTRVAAAPATGQYAVNETTGVYTFAAADKQLQVYMDYLYSSAATGSTVTITNKRMGDAPTFMAVLTRKYKNKTKTMILNACISDKFTLPFKAEDHAVYEFDFEAMADANGDIGKISAST
jgi:hypothetical protein